MLTRLLPLEIANVLLYLVLGRCVERFGLTSHACRFDCLCVVKDQVDTQMDERLAQFVVQSHHHSHPANQMDELQRAAAGEAVAAAAPGQAANAIDQDLLRLYIAYAKKNCHPKLQDADTAKMVQACPHLLE